MTENDSAFDEKEYQNFIEWEKKEEKAKTDKDFASKQRATNTSYQQRKVERRKREQNQAVENEVRDFNKRYVYLFIKLLNYSFLLLSFIYFHY